MLKGRVIEEGTVLAAFIELDIAAPGHDYVCKSFRIDTGFDDFIQLPSTEVGLYQETRFVRQTYELANGKRVQKKVYFSNIQIGDLVREHVRTLVQGAATLVGTHLLRGADVQVSMVADGDVTISFHSDWLAAKV